MKTKPAKIAENIRKLADWYQANKPSQISITVSHDDSTTILDRWEKTEGRRECESAGFHVSADKKITWHTFAIVTQERKSA